MRLAIALLLLSVGCAAAQQRASIRVERAAPFDCRAVEGERIVLVQPDWGAVVIASEPFEGAERLGRIEAGTIFLSMPGLRMPELQLEGEAEGPELWGRSLGRGFKGAPGCEAIAATDDPQVALDAILAKVKRESE